MKFVNLTDSSQIKIRNLTESIEDYMNAMNHISDFYAISDGKGKGLARLAMDNQEVILLNVKKKKFGVHGFTIDCDLTPDATPEEIEDMLDLFTSVYMSRN